MRPKTISDLAGDAAKTVTATAVESTTHSPKRAADTAADTVAVRPTRPGDLQALVEISQRVYRDDPWCMSYLWSQLCAFPEGQLVAVDNATGRVCGMAASLILDDEAYGTDADWCTLTDSGRFTNHDPAGRTLYGAEVMVDPRMQGRGVGKKIYAARRRLCRELGLDHIRAGARLRGYHRYADTLSAEQYVDQVVAGALSDPTLSFQLKQGFRVLGVTRDYLPVDPASHGHAAVIEWRSARLLLPDAAIDWRSHPAVPQLATA